MSNDAEKKEEQKQVPPQKFDASTGLLGAGFWLVVMGIAIWSNDKGRVFLTRWWWAVLTVIALCALLALFPAIRKKAAKLSPKWRTGLLVFMGLPLIVAVFTILPLKTPESQAAVLRIVFLATVCLLPATLYYLFIATRKSSLLHDYLYFLNRTGLMNRARGLGHYLQKFEAVYGPLPGELTNRILESSDPKT